MTGEVCTCTRMDKEGMGQSNSLGRSQKKRTLSISGYIISL